MQQVADVVDLGAQPRDYLLLIFGQVQYLDELVPIDQVILGEVAVVQQKVNFLGGQSNVQDSEHFLERKVADLPCFLFVNFLESLLECFWATEDHVLQIIDLNILRGTNLLH